MVVRIWRGRRQRLLAVLREVEEADHLPEELGRGLAPEQHAPALGDPRRVVHGHGCAAPAAPAAPAAVATVRVGPIATAAVGVAAAAAAATGGTAAVAPAAGESQRTHQPPGEHGGQLRRGAAAVQRQHAVEHLVPEP